MYWCFLKPALGHERGAPVIEQQHPVLDLCLNLHRMWPCSSPSSFLLSLFSLGGVGFFKYNSRAIQTNVSHTPNVLSLSVNKRP